ncbi:MAG: DUF488 family protein [Sphingopyxis sp.]|uniref:DUF488 domain-containing protein n=1 Tax=Sphingopyxis sp. TaxID=1908224 RepID=UPI002ABB7B21|nr:DUF488 family protein [Sphingopyxis sp.]MDZ3830422.1 DUF488 family protein [Sphingopyxis sp.]
MGLSVKRIYDPADEGDGARFLVDRLWPRGVSKDRAALTAWVRALSPSDALRKDFHGETAGSDAAWAAFRRAYFAELDAGGEAIEAALREVDAALACGPVTLLYAAKDDMRNNAVALRDWLDAR